MNKIDVQEIYLYYILEKHAKTGKTLIFVNSISCIRRLVPILQILKIPAFSLHANMVQKQRLKNLDRFSQDLHNSSKETNNDSSDRRVLIATDVAARGLDIPDIDLVIHYQLPRATDIYIHRSGRTARAQKHGRTILFVDPEDKPAYKKILTHLGRNSADGELEDIPDAVVDSSIIPAIRKRVQLARKIDSSLHSLKNISNSNKWINKMAKDADLDDDEKL